MSFSFEYSETGLGTGPVFMSGMPGPGLDTATETLIAENGLGGIILFARNIEDPIQVATLCRDLQRVAMKHQGMPLFIGVDQEGGRVARLREPFTVFPGNTAMGDDPDPAARATEFGKTTAMEMRLVGLNMDMAPVLDVPRGIPERYLDGRTFGNDPEMVSWIGRIVIKTLQDGGIISVAKHFPGLGMAALDPHKDLLSIKAEKAEIESVDLLPFQGAIEEGVMGIMTSHAVYSSLDSINPGTLSAEILGGLLRNRLHFNGLIITDDMEMGAIQKERGGKEGVFSAFEAGADILLICEDQDLVLESMGVLRSRVREEEWVRKRLRESAGRILDLKSKVLLPFHEISLAAVRDYFSRGSESQILSGAQT